MAAAGHVHPLCCLFRNLPAWTWLGLGVCVPWACVEKPATRWHWRDHWIRVPLQTRCSVLAVTASLSPAWLRPLETLRFKRCPALGRQVKARETWWVFCPIQQHGDRPTTAAWGLDHKAVMGWALGVFQLYTLAVWLVRRSRLLLMKEGLMFDPKSVSVDVLNFLKIYQSNQIIIIGITTLAKSYSYPQM